MSAGHTPGPWFAHGFTYPHGVVGDVFARDSDNVLSATPICRVVEPVSKMDGDLRRPPLDALQAIARKDAARPIIEANARLIAAAPDLLEALRGVDALWSEHDDGKGPIAARNPKYRKVWTAVRAAIAHATGEQP